ncbi:alpha/beta hydrolase [Flavobacterium sp. PL02]|uniref:alpha/beta hydrolase n=1 Tax=Flavobacterium sp. PL02 TaxID=3088354 RepID=UPI002B23395A|nr:alpha/beta hydrolase [Flavobacterium sp. PL02]MEA9412791.1 alpha/beta hydrolase [Flavobacterium sp. PL02]
METIKRVNLWNNNMPTNSGLIGNEILHPNEVIEISNITQTEIIIYSPTPSLNTGRAIIICPGGAYAGLAITPQGYDFAEWLSSIGIMAIVLKYRMPNTNKEIPLDDVKEAIRYVRRNSKTLNLDDNKIGIAGFSAGGHLAALVSTLSSKDGIEYRPDFSILFYPVITMNSNTQINTRENLLGNQPSIEDIEAFSCENQVSVNTPPTLILTSNDDTIVSPINSIMYYEALRNNGIDSSLFIFPQGDHGWGIKGINMFGNKFQYIEQAKDLITNWIMNLTEAK